MVKLFNVVSINILQNFEQPSYN